MVILQKWSEVGKPSSFDSFLALFMREAVRDNCINICQMVRIIMGGGIGRRKWHGDMLPDAVHD